MLSEFEALIDCDAVADRETVDDALEVAVELTLAELVNVSEIVSLRVDVRLQLNHSVNPGLPVGLLRPDAMNSTTVRFLLCGFFFVPLLPK